MFFGHISTYNPIQYPQAIQFALSYLKNTDFDAMEAGVYELKGRSIFVQVLDLDTQPIDAFQPETHRNYIDVQYLHRGEEIMGVAIEAGQHQLAQAYDETRDIMFYQPAPTESKLVLRAGNFAVFFPGDLHRTTVTEGASSKIRKIVVKVAVSELEESK